MISSDTSDTSSQNSTPGRYATLIDEFGVETSENLKYLNLNLDKPEQSPLSDNQTDSPNSFTHTYQSPYQSIKDKHNYTLDNTTNEAYTNADNEFTQSQHDSEESRLDVEMLRKQLFAHHTKLPKRPILRLLESLSVDTNSYYQPENIFKSKQTISPKISKSNTTARTLNESFKDSISTSHEGHTTSTQDHTITQTDSTTHTHDHNIEQKADNTQNIELVGTQKEDSLIWCHQQISTVKSTQENDCPVYFHQAVLADSAPSNILSGLFELRNPDRVTSPDELDEILCLLTCAGKLFITELMAYAQSIEKMENNKNQTSPSSGNYTQFSNSQDLALHNSINEVGRKRGIRNISSQTSRVLTSKHIYEAIKKMNSL